jgi:hypothetical protein
MPARAMARNVRAIAQTRNAEGLFFICPASDEEVFDSRSKGRQRSRAWPASDAKNQCIGRSVMAATQPRNAGHYRDAMGIAAGVFALRPAPRRPRCLRGRTRRPTSSQGCPSFRLLFGPELAVAIPRRGSRCETADLSGLRPACSGEAGSPRDAWVSGL